MSARSLQSLALLCAAIAVGLICLFFTHHAGSDRELLEDDTRVRKIGRPAIRLSLAHQQLTKMAIFRKKAAMQALSDCGCVGGHDELSDNTWGHYTPECCNPSKDRDSLDSVLDSYIQNALDGTQNLSVALTQAKKKMDKKLSVIIDAVTLKNAGRPGPPGPDGPQGPTGYPGAPGPQGPRGPAGLLGAVGPKGAPGPEGYRGATGDIGPKGLQGYIGTPGSPGFTGPDGLRGIVGSMGPPGPKGPPGPPGNPGMMGRTGDNGPTGPKGRDGRVLNVNGYVEDTDACQSACGGGLDALSSQLITCRRRWGDAFVEAFHMGGNGNYGVNGCGGCSGKYYTTCISPAMNPTAAFTQCATENQVCTCTGNVRYGVPGSWTNVKSVTGSVVCGNSAFGDPIYGTAKTCQCASASDLGVTGCETVMSSCQVARGTTINFLDRQSVTCPDGKLISEMQMVSDGCPANQLRYRSVCCQPVRGLSNCRQVQTNCQYVNTYDVIYFDRQNVACDQFEAMSSWQFTKDGCPSDNMKYVYNCCKLSF